MLTKALATLFDKAQRGIARQMTGARAEVIKALVDFEKLCAKYDMQPAYHAVEIDARQIIQTASVTITEATLIQHLKDTKMTATLKKVSVQDTLDHMLDHVLASDAIESAIYEKALEVLKD